VVLSLRDTVRTRCSGGGSSVRIVNAGCEWYRAWFSGCGSVAASACWSSAGCGGGVTLRTTDAHAPRCSPDGDAGTLKATEYGVSVDSAVLAPAAAGAGGEAVLARRDAGGP